MSHRGASNVYLYPQHCFHREIRKKFFFFFFFFGGGGGGAGGSGGDGGWKRGEKHALSRAISKKCIFRIGVFM